MDNFYKWFAVSPVASFVRHFLSLVIASAIAEFANLGGFDFTNWRLWIITGLVAAAPPLLRWLNPVDTLK